MTHLININIVILILGINLNCWSQDYGYGSEFHEFVTKFSQGKTKQIDNISFPLLFVSDNDTTFIQKDNWKNIDYCFGCEFSPMLFMGDSINHNDVYYTVYDKNNYIISAYLKPENKIQNFYFSKIKESYFLNKIVVTTIKSSSSESFFKFINKFASDTSFINQRITKEAKYITWEENPSELIESTLDINAFDGDDYLFKRIYINKFDLEADNVVLYIMGEGTGYHLEYYFSKTGGKWYLIKLVNIGV